MNDVNLMGVDVTNTYINVDMLLNACKDFGLTISRAKISSLN